MGPLRFFQQINQFEEGLLSENETITLFSDLISSGAICALQGSYGRFAAGLIAEGVIADDGTVLRRMVNGELVEVDTYAGQVVSTYEVPVRDEVEP